MKYIAATFCILLACFTGCQNGYDIIATQIKFIRYRSVKDGTNITRDIYDPKIIKQVVREINNAEKDPAVFMSRYTLSIKYLNQNEQLVICNADRIKINGLTYKTAQSIDHILKP